MVATTTSAIKSSQSAIALPGIPCDACAKDFAPGQLSKNSEIDKDTKFFAPGQEAKFPGSCVECNGNDFAPGQLKKQTGGLGQ